jgi:hypothetical protein
VKDFNEVPDSIFATHDVAVESEAEFLIRRSVWVGFNGRNSQEISQSRNTQRLMGKTPVLLKSLITASPVCPEVNSSDNFHHFKEANKASFTSEEIQNFLAVE